MADVAVAVVALSVPPVVAYKTTYRPALTVRNSGARACDVSGQLRIYSAGSLFFTTSIALAGLDAGATDNALASNYVTFAAEGEYVVQADIEADFDPGIARASLSPVTIVVAGDPPTPPSPVADHATQHEAGGGDEVNITGLRGVGADPQTPAAHHTSHGAGQSDPVDVTGLTGKLADPQTPEDHASRHGVGGADEISVDGLHGQLADPQPVEDHAPTHAFGGGDPVNVNNLPGKLADRQRPDLHAAAHASEGDDPVDVTDLPGLLKDAQRPRSHHGEHEDGGTDQIDLGQMSGLLMDPQIPTVHGADTHDTSVEKTANRGQPNGYCGLTGARQIPDDQLVAHNADGDAHPEAIARHNDSATAHEDNAVIERTTHKNIPGGYAGLDAQGLIPGIILNPSIQSRDERGQPDGYCDLDSAGLVPADRLGEESLPAHGQRAHTTDTPIMLLPGTPSDAGASQGVAAAEHHHRTPGGIITIYGGSGYITPASGEEDVLNHRFPDGFMLQGGTRLQLRTLNLARGGTNAALTLKVYLSGPGFSSRVYLFTRDIFAVLTARMMHNMDIVIGAGTEPTFYAYGSGVHYEQGEAAKVELNNPITVGGPIQSVNRVRLTAQVSGNGAYLTDFYTSLIMAVDGQFSSL